MRWKLYGDIREDPYKCCWFIHVRTGTVLLGLYSLVCQPSSFRYWVFFAHCGSSHLWCCLVPLVGVAASNPATGIWV